MTIDYDAVERLIAGCRAGEYGTPVIADVLGSLLAEVAFLNQELDSVSGPHCSSCGNAIDPECCWCGDGPASSHNYEDHGFIPMGCDCSRDPTDRDWKKVASALRKRLRSVSSERDRLSEVLASTRAQTEYAQAEVLRMQPVVEAAERWLDDERKYEEVEDLEQVVSDYRATKVTP